MKFVLTSTGFLSQVGSKHKSVLLSAVHRAIPVLLQVSRPKSPAQVGHWIDFSIQKSHSMLTNSLLIKHLRLKGHLGMRVSATPLTSKLMHMPQNFAQSIMVDSAEAAASV